MLERRIAALNKVVTDTRKGVRNVIKKMVFWKAKEEPPAGVKSSGIRYAYDRIEAQMLLLADTCFIIKVGQ